MGRVRVERNEEGSCSKFAQASRRMRGRRGRGWLKNPYKGEKRKTGWGDSFEGRSSGERREREEGGGRWKKRGRKTEQGRKRGARLEFARFIPPPVFKLRPDVFPSPASLSALLFLLNRWYLSYFVGISQSSRLNSRYDFLKARCISKNRGNYTS